MRTGSDRNAVANDFLLALDEAMTYARDLLSDLDSDLARARACRRGSDREYALLHAQRRIRIISRNLARARARASSGDRSAARGLIRDRHRASAIALDYDRARILRDSDHNLGNAFDLVATLTNACTFAAELRRFSNVDELVKQYKAVPLAGRLIAIAARLLPSAERARYDEEFRSELAVIARAGGGRRAQLAYAARTVLNASWQLRAALRSPRRRGAVP